MPSRPANVSLIHRRCSGRSAAQGREDNPSTEPHPLTICSMSEPEGSRGDRAAPALFRKTLLGRFGEIRPLLGLLALVAEELAAQGASRNRFLVVAERAQHHAHQAKHAYGHKGEKHDGENHQQVYAASVATRSWACPCVRIGGRARSRPPRASDVLGRLARGVVQRRVIRLSGDTDGVPRVLGALVRLRPPNAVASRPETGTPPVLVESNREANQRFLLVAGFATCTRCYGPTAGSTSRSDLRTSRTALVRVAWETPTAPYRWACFSLLLAGGPGCYLGRPLSRESYFSHSAERLPQSGEHR
jgi:hypothetical protein